MYTYSCDAPLPHPHASALLRRHAPAAHAAPRRVFPSELLGKEVYIKLDAMQPSGSFKLRGIGYTCQKALRRGATQLVSSSGGNAGLATAYAGQRLGVPTTVVVPESTPEFIRDRLRSYGRGERLRGSRGGGAPGMYSLERCTP